MKIAKRKLIFIIIASVLLLVSIVFYAIFYPGNRVTMIFESMDSNLYYCESRFMPINTVQGDLEFFVDELLLGPVMPRYRPLFANGTQTLSCFVDENDTLYINLNEKALLAGDKSSEPLMACNLLKKNIFKNFSNIKNIEIYIMGNLIDENNKI